MNNYHIFNTSSITDRVKSEVFRVSQLLKKIKINQIYKSKAPIHVEDIWHNLGWRDTFQSSTPFSTPSHMFSESDGILACSCLIFSTRVISCDLVTIGKAQFFNYSMN